MSRFWDWEGEPVSMGWGDEFPKGALVRWDDPAKPWVWEPSRPLMPPTAVLITEAAFLAKLEAARAEAAAKAKP